MRIWSAAVLSLAGLLPAQWSEKADVDPEKQARRLVSFMELPDRRREAVAELLQLGPVAVPALCGKFRDPRPEVVFRCLTALRALGPAAKAALPHLDQLQKSDDAALRHGAAWCAHGIRSTGITLVLQKGASKVLLVDAAGKTVRETGKLEAIYDAELLADGRILICRTSGEVQELDANDKVVWEYNAGVAIDVDRLANGNTLISCGRDKRVIEVDRAGKIVWQWKTPWPNDVDRLASGNTLVADVKTQRVAEVDPAGEVVWSVPSQGPIDAERLANGNTLVALNQACVVREFDPDGKVVRDFDAIKSPKCAIRLANGNTLIGGIGAWGELDAQGKVLRKVQLSGEIPVLHRY